MKKKLFLTTISILVVIVISVTASYLITVFNHSKIYSSKDSNEFVERLDNEFPNWMKKYKVPGVAIGLIENDKIIWQKGYGFADKKSNTKVTQDTIFRIASISKPITAWGIMNLVEQGKINLDAPAEKYLTRWHIPPSKFDTKGVTIRRLLSHTAGLSVQGAPGYDPDKPLPTIEQSLSGIAGKQWRVGIVNKPGNTFQYSGGGFSVLQLIVEEVTGTKFADYMKSEIFNPLNLKHTRYDRKYKDNTTIATAYTGDGKAIVDRPWIEHASGGVYTNLADLSTFTAACMNDSNGTGAGRGVLKSDSLEKMFSPQLNTKSSFGVYGLGFIPTTLKNGEKLITHSGDITGWNAQIAFLPKEKRGIVILTNGDAGYYFKSDVLGVWTNWATGSNINETKFLRIMQATLLSLAFFLDILFLYFIYNIKKQFTSKRRIVSLISNNKFDFKYCMKVILPALLVAIWYFIFYSKVPFKIIFKLDDYLLFTFLSPELFWVTLVVTIFGIVLTLLNILTKKIN
ncbi:serine hydrolase [Clostridium sporogenes]|uniref:Serine hydrolase n=1 Tax=Clostridium sporogenes TaxID=1509 RepID=A0ABD6RQS6_CLOSG|nr:serine hydrolase domain-containing protein [Clostridium sporogenes]EKS4342358.1 beta-lactamase family protein [Clostridium botulinum]EKS4393825.1 beta-lactamase family protein [Clostridium botulinum]MCR1973467.1 beta-lactamase family protein [Clostridium sporogenes]OSB18701.1 serine hydrolase [Clostridium sporogenes]